MKMLFDFVLIQFNAQARCSERYSCIAFLNKLSAIGSFHKSLPPGQVHGMMFQCQEILRCCSAVRPGGAGCLPGRRPLRALRQEGTGARGCRHERGARQWQTARCGAEAGRPRNGEPP